MKKLSAFLLLLPVLLLLGFTAGITVTPSEPAPGEVFQIQIHVDRAGEPEFTLPSIPGLQISRRINSTSSRTSIINGKREQKFIYGLNARAAKPGKYTIAPVDITVKGEKSTTRAVEFTVYEPDGKNNSGNRPQAQLVFIPSRPVYAGETVHAVLRLQVPPDFNLRDMKIQEQGFGDAVFDILGKNRQRWRQLPGRRTGMYEFAATFQMPRSGKFTPVCELLLQTVVQDRSDPFGGFFSMGQIREIPVSAAGKTLQVLPLPEAPADTVNTGLIGNWQIAMSVPGNKTFKTGEVAELTLDITGNAPLKNFHAPQLTLPDARIYPPEVQVRPNGCSVKYIFVPLVPGTRDIRQTFAVFDPEKGLYRKELCSVSCQILPGNVPVPAGKTPLSAAPVPEKVAAKVQDFPVYPLPPGGSVTLPLWENQKTWIILFTLAGAVMLTVSFLYHCFGKCDPEKREYRRRMQKFSASLKCADDINEFFRQHGVTEIAAATGLPAGATAKDIAEKLDDPELRNFFLRLNSSGFRPGNPGDTGAEPDVRKKLLQLIKKTLAILLMFAALPVWGGFHQGRDAFDRGDYTQAKEYFRQMINPDAPDPYSVYNFGCPQYMLGDYPRATLAFEQALLMNPGDARLKAAYHDALAKLPGIPEPDDGSLTAFISSVRDRFRPDHYLLAASILFALFGFGSLFRQLPWKKSIMTAVATAMLLCLFAAWSQTWHRYSPDRARIIAARAELHRLPAGSGSVAGIIPGGSEVTIAEKSGNWVRIILPDASGWVKASEVQEVCKHGLW